MCQVKLEVIGFIKHKTLALIFKKNFHDGKKQKMECPLWHAFYFTKCEEWAIHFSNCTPHPPLHCMEETNELGNMPSNYIEKIEVGLHTYL
jgi:hypothetical protein